MALGACSSGAEAGPAATAAQQGVTHDSSELAPIGVIRDALDKVSLRPEQKAEIEQMTASATSRHQAVRAAHEALRAAIADQVLAGKIDRAALKPQIDALVAAIDNARPDDRAALVRLHDLLDKQQRDELVRNVESSFRTKMQDHRGGHAGPHEWAADLNLTDAQRDQLRAVMKDQFHRAGAERRGEGRERWRAMHEQGRRVLQSFREDKFSLDGAAPPFGRDKIEQHLARMLDVAEAALPILKPEQRAIAAQKIRTLPMPHH
jgi:Spy/CpxP family protein refolding chaperone